MQYFVAENIFGRLLYEQDLKGVAVDSSRRQHEHVLHPQEIIQHYILMTESASIYLNYVFGQIIYCYSQPANI